MYPSTNHNNVLDLLIIEITNGTIKPGSRLVERTLSTKFGVSRTPVREALRKLEQMHIVKFEPYKGARVRQFHKAEAEDIFELRVTLEGFAAKTCAINATKNDICKLEKAMQSFKLLTDKDEEEIDLNKLFEYNNTFHNLIIAGSHNHMLVNIMKNFQIHVSLLRHLSLPKRPLISLDEHIGVLNAIKERNPEKAEELAAQHIKLTWEFAKKYYNEH